MTSAGTAVLGRGTGTAMGKPPCVVLSCAVSLDGRIDGTGPSRTVLSSIADLARVDTAFLAADLVNEIQLSVALLLIGAAGAPRFVRNAPFPCAGRRLHLLDVRVLDDCVLLCYRMGAGAAA